MGLLVNKDAMLFRRLFKEAAKLRGIQVLYQYPIDMELSNYAEENPTGFSEAEEMDVIFEENPNIRTLKRYNWVTEGSNEVPYMAQLPYDAKYLAKGCRITIPSPLSTMAARIFVVTDIKTSLEFPESWTCRLAPVFDEKVPQKQIEKKTAEQSTSFLKVDL